ncbi:MAG: hypothetical protein KKC18_02465 [Chloroflexi bacterium]|nr:hypothetical protein [Chloroflexota bacterium]
MHRSGEATPGHHRRQRELAQLLADLQPGRIVTLCGPSGIGSAGTGWWRGGVAVGRSRIERQGRVWENRVPGRTSVRREGL